MIDLVVRGLARDDGDKVLSVKHIGKDYWCLPGGKVEEGEELTAAMKREMVEELGVEPEIGRLLHVYQLFLDGGKAQRVEFIFEIKNALDYAKIDHFQTSHGPAELEEVEWLDLSKTNNFLPPFIKDYLDNPSSFTELHITR